MYSKIIFLILTIRNTTNYAIWRKNKGVTAKRGYSIQTLADMVGVSKPAIQQYEDDTISPSNKVLKKISEALGVGVWYFFFFSGKQKKTKTYRL
ncbi:helix-turn-helix transcriptional regulator [Niabella sp. W65]|nr:helix-turn-helix transcriptional regulator [Niabella sp. W65]MCH7365815.1 helix-turn-helix transcriptional regulator [Niabella sp. W65]